MNAWRNTCTFSGQRKLLKYILIFKLFFSCGLYISKRTINHIPSEMNRMFKIQKCWKGLGLNTLFFLVWTWMLCCFSGDSSEHGWLSHVRVGACGPLWTGRGDYPSGRRHGNHSSIWRYLYPFNMEFILVKEVLCQYIVHKCFLKDSLRLSFTR